MNLAFLVWSSAVALAGPPVQVAATATTTLVAPSSLQGAGELNLDLDLDDDAAENGAELQVEVGAHGGLTKAGKGVRQKEAKKPQARKEPVLRGARTKTNFDKASAYVVSGFRKGVFSVSLPSGSECVLTAPGATLAVNRFKLSVAEEDLATLSPDNFTLDDQGVQSFRVDATLNLAAHQARKKYHGHFDLTVAWD